MSKNRKPQQHYPLLHHAGIVEQVAERWTAERTWRSKRHAARA